MKILLLNNFHYRKGGSETVYFNIGNLLSANGHEVEYFSLQQKENIPATFSEFFPKSSLSVNSKLSGARYYLNNKEAAQNLEKVLDQFKPDVAHIHLIWGGLTASVLRVLRRHNIPVVHTVHDYRMVCPAYLFLDNNKTVCEKCHGHNFYHAITRKCSKGSLAQSCLMAIEAYYRNLHNSYSLFNHVIYVSKFCRDIHFKYNKTLSYTPSSVLYNFNPTKNIKIGNPTERKYFTYLGRLSKEKGIMTLIKAFEDFPEQTLQIVGTGPLETELKDYVSQNKLTNVIFRGYMSGNTLQNVIAESKFIIVPSEWYENNPMSVIESLSAGIPVIGSDIGGIPEIIEDGKTGFIFHSANIDELVKTIRKAISIDTTEYTLMCDNARSFALDNFGEQNYYNKLIEIYLSVVKSK